MPRARSDVSAVQSLYRVSLLARAILSDDLAMPPKKSKPNKAAAITKKSPVSASAKRARVLISLVKRRLGRIVEDFYEIGQALRELYRNELWKEMGYASFREMIEATGIKGTSQAFKLIAVVEQMSREQAIDLGAERAYALTRLVEATPEPDSVPLLLESGVIVSKRGAKKPKKVPATELTVAELTQMTRDQPGKPKRKENAEERAARSRGRKAQATVRKRGASQAKIELSHVKGKWWARVDLPLDQLVALIGAVG